MAFKYGLAFALIVFLLIEGGITSYTTEDITTLRAEIRTWIDSDTVTEILGTRALIPGLTRLSFHDCVGGCDGCINKDNPENVGLERYIDVIEDFYQNDLTLDMSRADFWNLAAIEAMTYASEIGTSCPSCSADELPLEFRHGRMDCVTSDGGPYTNDEHEFPDATKSGTHSFEFFAEEFNMATRQTVAIMGAHTLGRCRIGASGFTNPWVTHALRMNNDYYISMMNESYGWSVVEIERNKGTNRWQWDSNGELMMLNTDMGLLLDIEGQIDEETGAVTGCDYATCSVNEDSIEYMAEFALDNAGWLAAFAEAWDLMTMNGYSSDELPILS